MRIAYICTDFGIPIYGAKGASIHVRELSQALHELGHEMLIVTPRAGGAGAPHFDVPVNELKLEAMATLTHDLLRAEPHAGPLIANEIRSLQYNAVFPHRARSLLEGFAPDVIYERYALWGSAGVALARELEVPLLLEVNAPLSDEQAAHRGLAFDTTARGLDRMVFGAADRVIAVSDELKQWLIVHGAEAERVTVLPNGVALGRFEGADGAGSAVRAQLGVTDQAVVGFLGTLKPWHGTDTLVRAVAKLHRCGVTPYLLIVGDGPERQALTALAEDEGIGHTTIFTGALPHEDIPSYLAAMDIAVAPYHQTENFYFSPLKIFEYMAAARPIVAAAVGQIRGCIIHGKTGFLYPPGDVAALADALNALLADRIWATALGQTARAYVRDHHTWEQKARVVEELAQGLLLPQGEAS